ncbi:hypothetical protein [Phreatobacter sp. AB_2022a]|uniref:hypothetical protein n=1 Tax=Phreatobacter sp. AB_2022a TaxID=3003134 RepID=UPI0022870779|nr:hypothetical protein [Phreatobacter sp. AB_2022a]MCZ0734736.1 hypothetical protein [Phreatobacter sp. AB_2022a]
MAIRGVGADTTITYGRRWTDRRPVDQRRDERSGGEREMAAEPTEEVVVVVRPTIERRIVNRPLTSVFATHLLAEVMPQPETSVTRRQRVATAEAQYQGRRSGPAGRGRLVSRKV